MYMYSNFLSFLYASAYTINYIIIVEPPIKDTPNKGHLRIKDTIQSTKKSLSYCASTFLTSDTSELRTLALVPRCPFFVGSTVYPYRKTRKSCGIKIVRFTRRSLSETDHVI